MARAGQKAAIGKLRALLASDGESEHFIQFAQEAYKQKSDRAAALVIVANTDNALQYGLSRRLAVAYEDDRLFGNGSPMDTFDKKIRMAVALRLIGPETENNLQIVKQIRNAFAHSNIHLTFKTQEIASLCRFLVLPIINPPKTIKVRNGKIIAPRRPKITRKLFAAVCDAIAHNIMVNGHLSTQLPRQDPKYPGLEIWLKPPSLP